MGVLNDFHLGLEEISSVLLWTLFMRAKCSCKWSCWCYSTWERQQKIVQTTTGIINVFVAIKTKLLVIFAVSLVLCCGCATFSCLFLQALEAFVQSLDTQRHVVPGDAHRWGRVEVRARVRLWVGHEATESVSSDGLLLSKWDDPCPRHLAREQHGPELRHCFVIVSLESAQRHGQWNGVMGRVE